MGTGELRRSRGYRALIVVGLVSYGVVHLVVAWIAVRIASGGRRRPEASPEGALQQLAAQPLGEVLLWTMAVGLVTLTLWQVLEASVGINPERSHVTRKRVSSVGRAAIYLALALSAAKVALGAGSSARSTEVGLTARVLNLPYGPALVTAAGVAVLVVGIGQIRKGAERSFTDDLRRGVAKPVLGLGAAGYAIKGVVLTLVGGLIGWAAVTHDPKKAGGLDAALVTLRRQPYGPHLLTGVAVGVACFGLYCFAWAKNARH